VQKKTDSEVIFLKKSGHRKRTGSSDKCIPPYRQNRLDIRDKIPSAQRKSRDAEIAEKKINYCPKKSQRSQRLCSSSALMEF
jgi:hypothetical protein